MSEVSQEIRSASRSGTIWGILVLLLGVFCMAVPWIPGMGIVIMVGIALLATGVIQLIFAFQSDSFGTGAFRVLFGLLAAFMGGWLISKPGAGLAALTLFLAAWFFVDGVYAIVAAIRWRPNKGWGMLLISGIVSIILALMIYHEFPESSLWLVGVLVGVRLLFAGLTMIILGSAGRALAKRVDQAADPGQV